MDDATAPQDQLEGAPEGTTPEGVEGQAAPEGTSESTPEPAFYDPKDLPEELQGHYKQMQAAFTKKMQNLSKDRQKIEAYDAFFQNPIEQMQRVAQQYGYNLSKPGETQEQPTEDWQPNTWGDVMSRAKKEARDEIMNELQPYLGQIQNMRQQTIERQLAEIDPTWQQYEDKMMANLRSHPTLANDPAMLYRLSVPQEVLESRATQQALKRLEEKGRQANVSGGSTTNKQPAGLPDKPLSFQEAVDAAKRKLAEDGIKAP